MNTQTNTTVNNTLTFLYQESQIHFLINPLDKNVMINATEMAKVFNRKTTKFLKTDSTKSFIEALERDPKGSRSDVKIIDNRGHMGIYFNKLLALKFASWLDVNFELWVYSRIEQITFGNYKKHWDAHVAQELAKSNMDDLKEEILLNPTVLGVEEYFRYEQDYKDSKSLKSKAIRNQLKLFKI